jgi:hypothetical protein
MAQPEGQTGEPLSYQFQFVVCAHHGQSVDAGLDCARVLHGDIKHLRAVVGHDRVLYFWVLSCSTSLRRDPLESRKATLEMMLAKAGDGIRLNEHIEGDGPAVFWHACKLGLEGIVSKRKGSPYCSGRSPDWLKSKSPACAAVKREEEEDWS